MILFLISLIVMTLCYLIKGGQAAHLFKNWEEQKDKKKILKLLLGGKLLSTIMLGVFLTYVTIIYKINVGIMDNSYLSIGIIMIGWLASIVPSLGEEYGAIAKTGPYLKYPEFGRKYGLKKTVERGSWIGAMMCLGTFNPTYICFSLLFLPVSWLGFYIGNKIKIDGWAMAEGLVGLVVYGLPTALFLTSKI